MKKRGWEQCDFVYVSGDAYVDHPSFGTAIISRLLEAQILGRPRLGFLVSAGNMDSMVNHYSVSKKRRKEDSYTPGGVMGKRPDYAVVVYCNLIRSAYKDVPIIAGGIEASLRRLAHYDYWSNKMKRSILLDAQADIISYGMGEHSIVELADALDSGLDIKDITFIDGTVYKTKSLESVYDYKLLPDYTELLEDKKRYAESFFVQYSNTDPFSGKRLVEPYSQNCFIVQNPASEPLTMEEMDQVYDLPFQRTWHPMYDAAGGIPALSEVKFSLVSCRGCFGGCSFCALTFHQGRIIQARSHESLIKEAKLMIEEPDFKGYIHDVGGPTADFRAPACEKQMTKGVCPHKQCLFPEPCKNLRADHSDYIALLRKLRALPKVKKVFIRSGIRFDYVLADKKSTFLEELCRYHVSGQLKVAPEHVSDPVLACLGKPKAAVYQEFCRQYKKMNERLGLKQYLVPYLMSSHPGSTMKEAVELAEYCRDLGYMPEQVQDFYPTPSTISTCMYYTGLDPRTMTAVYVPKDPHEKEMQRALIQYRNPANRVLVREALLKAGREDLIGYGPKCLLRPDQARGDGRAAHRDDNRRVEKRSAGRGRGASSGRTADRNNTQSRSQNQEQTQERRPTQKKKTIRNVHRKK